MDGGRDVCPLRGKEGNVMGVHSPRSAFEAAVAYVADGDELMATRMYVENRLSYVRYLEALRRGARTSGEGS